MQQIKVVILVLISILALAGCGPDRYTQRSRERSQAADSLAMKKQDVITLTKAGVSDSLIVTMIDASNSWFQLNTQDVLDLKNAGVSDKVINAMVESNQNLAEEPGDREYYYPAHYWYAGYYPYWYRPSWYIGLGYRAYRPFTIGHSIGPRHIYHGGRRR